MSTAVLNRCTLPCQEAIQAGPCNRAAALFLNYRPTVNVHVLNSSTANLDWQGMAPCRCFFADDVRVLRHCNHCASYRGHGHLPQGGEEGTGPGGPPGGEQHVCVDTCQASRVT